jgi:DNA-binding NtrC family response regulator
VEIGPELLARLREHPWPGNVRELRNTVERVLIFSQGRTPSLPLLEELLAESASTYSGQVPAQEATAAAPAAGTDGNDAASLRDALERYEREYIRERLRAHGGQVAATARELGLERSHLYKKMRALGINPEEAR